MLRQRKKFAALRQESVPREQAPKHHSKWPNLYLITGTMLWALALIAYFTGNVGMIGLSALSALAIVPTIAQHLNKKRRKRQLWVFVEARCLEHQVRFVHDRRGDHHWRVHLFCEFQLRGQLWRTTLDTNQHRFYCREAAEAFIGEHVGDEQEMTLYVNPLNPQHAML